MTEIAAEPDAVSPGVDSENKDDKLGSGTPCAGDANFETAALGWEVVNLISCNIT